MLRNVLASARRESLFSMGVRGRGVRALAVRLRRATAEQMRELWEAVMEAVEGVDPRGAHAEKGKGLLSDSAPSNGKCQ